MHQLREDLNDVTKIMMDNIDDVLTRGAALSGSRCLNDFYFLSVLSDSVPCIYEVIMSDIMHHFD